MGNDGGSIPGRRELVKEKKREQKFKHQALDRARAIYCALSKDPLKKPMVICRLGNIYNKSAIVSALVEKKMPKFFGHIRSLKDIKEANVTLKNSITGKPLQDDDVKIICPITQMEYDGAHKFCMLWTCGCVISERALKELHGDRLGKCVNCNKPYTSSDLISLNMTKEEQEKNRESLIKAKEKQIALKKEGTGKLAGARKMPEEEKEGIKKAKTETNGSKHVIEKIKESIFTSVKADPLKSLLANGAPKPVDPDDFMTRCAHRGLH